MCVVGGREDGTRANAILRGERDETRRRSDDGCDDGGRLRDLNVCVW